MNMNLYKFVADLMDNFSFFYMSLRKRKDIKLPSYKKIVEYYEKNKDNFYNDIIKSKPSVDIEKKLINTNKYYKTYDIRFSSPYPSPYPQNNIVHGRIWYVEDKAPSIIILYGWRVENWAFFEDAGRKFARYGFNSILFDIPYHISRKPKGTFSGEYMIGPNIIKTFEAIKQALCEISAIVKYFVLQGSENVGLFGVSLGAMLSALASTYEEKIKFAVLINPPSFPRKTFLKSRMQKLVMDNYKIEDIPLPYIRQVIRLTEIINPFLKKPLIDKKNILLISSLYDNMVPYHLTYRYWLNLGKPRFLVYPHGHLSILFFEKKLFPDIEDFLKKYK